MSEKTRIEMPCGTGKALERELIKAYTNVQLDVEIDGQGLCELAFVQKHYGKRRKYRHGTA